MSVTVFESKNRFDSLPKDAVHSTRCSEVHKHIILMVFLVLPSGLRLFLGLWAPLLVARLRLVFLVVP